MQDLKKVNDSWIPFWVLMVSFAITGTLFIKSLQLFPRTLTKDDVSSVFKWKILSAHIKWSIRSYTWIAYPMIIFFSGYLSTYFKPIYAITDAFLNFGILITGLLCLFATYRRSTISEQNKILWLLWGLFTYSFLAIIAITINLFNNVPNQAILHVINPLMAFLLTLSMVMCLFFSDTFDTGTIVRRTIVGGFIFTLIVILYNTIEHYFLHWLSEELHLSDVLVSSFLSGIFVMIFSPVHHRLMHFLERKIKKSPPHEMNKSPQNTSINEKAG